MSKQSKTTNIGSLKLTQNDRSVVERLRDTISSERIISYQFSDEQKGLMKQWCDDLLSKNPLIANTYIPPNGRALVDEIDAFGKFLLEKIFVGEKDLELLSNLRCKNHYLI